MLNDINIDQILEREENGNSYIVHITANSQYLSIEVQQKFKGDIWIGQFTPEQLQEITIKAKNPKKYHIFIKMLMSSLLGQTESVLIQILTYAQLQRKMNLSSGKRNISNNKKYIIMTYMSEFDKAHYPLALNFLEDPSADRLKITIRRLVQQISLSGPGVQNFQNPNLKQVPMLKYENQTLKARIKNLENKIYTLENRENENFNKSNLVEQKQMQNLKMSLTNKESEVEDLKKQIKQLTEANNKKQNCISDLKQQISEYKQDKIKKTEDAQTYALFEEKINQMNKQTEQLVSQLQHSRQHEKKSNLKITNLEKQLEKMINNKRYRANQIKSGKNNNLNSSRRSQSVKSEKSYKSHHSNQSHQSNRSNTSKNKQTSKYQTKPGIKVTNKSNANKNVIVSRKSSIYESDTQSSKLRKVNNSRVSPFRQTNKISNLSNSSKKKPQNYTSTMNRFEGNILANSRNRDRSRSKSRQKNVENSPPVDFPTDNFASSSQDQRNIKQALTKLRKNKVKMSENTRQNKTSKTTMGPLQKKISDIAEKLRKARNIDSERD